MFVFFHNLKEINDNLLENQTQTLSKQGKIFIQFTDIKYVFLMCFFHELLIQVFSNLILLL